jgi:hypothetical protein
MRELSGLTYDEIRGSLGITNEAACRAVFDARSAPQVDDRATQCVSIRRRGRRVGSGQALGLDRGLLVDRQAPALRRAN